MQKTTFPTIKDLFILLGIYLGGSIIGSIPAIALAARNGIEGLEENLQPAIAATAPLVTGLPLLLCMLYGWNKLGRPTWDLGFKNVSLGAGTLAVLGTLLIANGVTMVAEYLPGYEGFAEMMKEAMVPGWGMAIAVVLIAPVLEEALFRGVLARGFLRKTTPRAAIIFSGLLFGVMHLHPVHVFFAAIVGFSLGYVYYRTRALGLVILIHFINNGLSYYLGLQDLPERSEDLLGLSTGGVFGVSAALTGLGLCGLWLLGRQYPLAPVPDADRPPLAEDTPLAP